MQDKKITKGGRVGRSVMLEQNLLSTDGSVFRIRSHNRFYQGSRNKELRKILKRPQINNDGES
jgi:hypothetical protein